MLCGVIESFLGFFRRACGKGVKYWKRATLSPILKWSVFMSDHIDVLWKYISNLTFENKCCPDLFPQEYYPWCSQIRWARQGDFTYGSGPRTEGRWHSFLLFCRLRTINPRRWTITILYSIAIVVTLTRIPSLKSTRRKPDIKVKY